MVRKTGGFVLIFFTFAIMLSPARLSVCRLSSVCNARNARAPYSGGCSCRQFFYSIWYLDIQRKFLSSQGNPSVGELNAKGVDKYSDFGPIEDYMLTRTHQEMR